MQRPVGRQTNEQGAPRGRRLSDHLPPALRDGEIIVLFQPQVAMASGQIVGTEALVRWRRPGKEEVGAERLFAAAKRAELIAAVSDEIHDVALARAAAWPVALRHLQLSINVTARDLARPDFATVLMARMAQHDFAASRLTIEITEHDLIADFATASAVLEVLRDHGCRIALDDFGTGYSSLSYLKELPVDVIKLDARLSQDIEGSERGQVIVKGIIVIARALGLTVVVEGVETTRQRDLLAEAGADIYQGYLCAPPLTSEALEALIAER
ncbi:EAL domain-containing protein [Sphingomonas panacisoli]|uniref:EAL domain-containing protein n=1 Tax=Sphingomonas panacisoli TaxID=1813879 RepID=A0A5B8LHT2_9SPHN|nr:EAL domain-containing protein [Sphingomonas panacisoli]QDZ07663.1 EAL domain-containing protein [Sphingomonas panacisoli]